MRYQSITQWPAEGLYLKASHGSKRQITTNDSSIIRYILANTSEKEFMIIQCLFGDSMFFPPGDVLESWDEGPTGMEKWSMHIEKGKKKKEWPGIMNPWVHTSLPFFSVL